MTHFTVIQDKEAEMGYTQEAKIKTGQKTILTNQHSTLATSWNLNQVFTLKFFLFPQYCSKFYSQF